MFFMPLLAFRHSWRSPSLPGRRPCPMPRQIQSDDLRRMCRPCELSWSDFRQVWRMEVQSEERFGWWKHRQPRWNSLCHNLLNLLLCAVSVQVFRPSLIRNRPLEQAISFWWLIYPLYQYRYGSRPGPASAARCVTVNLKKPQYASIVGIQFVFMQSSFVLQALVENAREVEGTTAWGWVVVPD